MDNKNVIACSLKLLETFQFSKAIEFTKKVHKSDLQHPLPLLITALSSFASYDQIYYNLTFVEQKFLRRDQLISHYQSVIVELDKVISPLKRLYDESNPLSNQKIEANHFMKITQEIKVIAEVRIEMISIYRKLANNKDLPDYENIIKLCETIEYMIEENISHSSLKIMKFNLNSEIYIFHKLILSQIQMANYIFKDTIFNLHETSVELDRWRSNFEKDGKTKLKLPIYTWLKYFHSSLISKASLIFSKIFDRLEKDTDQDIRSIISNIDSGINYIQMIEHFSQKMEPQQIFLVLNGAGLTSADLNGYVCPCEFDEEQDLLKGLKSWPYIYSYPTIEGYPPNWPSIISLIQDYNRDLLLFKRVPVSYYDPTINMTYFMIQIDEKISLVVLFSKDMRKNSTSINDFLTNIADHLRNVKVFEKLTKLN